MGDVLAEVVLAHKSGLIADSVVNTFAFITTSTPPSNTEMDAIASDIVDFYNVVPSGHNAVAGFIGSQISRVANACHIKFYDLAGHLNGTPHGSPIRDVAFTLSAMVPGATPLPSELAAALSFRAAYNTAVEFAPGERPRASLRGRVFIGPLTQSTSQVDGTTGRVSLTTSFRETLTISGAALRDSTDSQWGVWSRKLAQLRDVELVWCDDAYDVQRRRGEKAIVRTAA